MRGGRGERGTPPASKKCDTIPAPNKGGILRRLPRQLRECLPLDHGSLDHLSEAFLLTVARIKDVIFTVVV